MKPSDYAALAVPLGNGLYRAVVRANGFSEGVPGYEATTRKLALKAARVYLGSLLWSFNGPACAIEADGFEAGIPNNPIEPVPQPEPTVPEIPAPNVPQPRTALPVDPVRSEPID